MEEQPTTSPVEVPVNPKQGFPLLRIGKTILFIIVIISLGAWVGFWANKTIKQIKPTIVVSPTPIASAPTPVNRQMSSIASQSAFLNAMQSIASLSASISALTLNDSTFNPPSIELPLGFDSK